MVWLLFQPRHASSLISFLNEVFFSYLAQMDSVDYDPFQHVRGFHRNLNLLVEESILFMYIVRGTVHVYIYVVGK